MTRAVVDLDARRLISTDGLDRTLFVEAGAGSGKTTQLVARIVSLVVHRGVPLPEVAAITFTEAAASELRTRIRSELERAGRSADPAAAQRATAALADADQAVISTLHGFASRILGEFAVDAGLPPRVRVLDEVASQLAHEDRWAHFVDSLYDDPDRADLLTRASILGVALEPRYAGQPTFQAVAASLDQNWDRVAELAGEALPELPPLALSGLRAATATLEDLPALCADPSDRLYENLTVRILPLLRTLDELPDDTSRLRALASSTWGPGNGGRKDAWGGSADTVRAVKAAIVASRTEAENVLRTASADVLETLLRLTAREVHRAAQNRISEGGLEFHDLLVLARDLLRSRPGVRATLGRRFRHLLLDEFQDTDPLQIDLATLITATVSDDSPPGSWAELHTEPGRLFFVGDAKQSIYRFRRADVELFLSARDRFADDGRAVSLITNFRTVAPVVTWVNEVFTRLMPSEVAGAQPAYVPLSAHRDPSPHADHRPVLLGGPHDDAELRAGDLRELEASDVAAAVSHVAAHPDEWPVFDDELGDWRPARLSDVLLLVPTRTSLPYLRTALETAGVPYRLATGTLVYDTQQVRDALAALAAVDDPGDELSLVAALRSPLYACSDVDLATFHAAGGRWDLRRDPPDDVAADHPVRAALAHLRTLWRDRWWHSPSDLLDRLLTERHAALLAFGDPRPDEVWRRLRFVVDQARAFEEAGGGALRAFLDWAALQGADGARVHEPLLAETDDEAVSILTVHGAKGLEFPITVLSGMTTQPGARRVGPNVLWSAEGRPEVSVRKDVATRGHEPRADLELEMDTYERQRLLYVAATRARDHLVVSCHHQTTTAGLTTHAALVWAAVEEQPELWRRWSDVAPHHATPPAPTPPAPPAPTRAAPPAPTPAALDDDRAAWIERREQVLAPQRRPHVTSATAIAAEALLTTSPHDPSDTAPDEIDPFADEPTDPLGAATPHHPPNRRARTGAAVGRAVHAVLEAVDLAAPPDPSRLTGLVERACAAEAITGEVDTVRALAVSALEAPTVRAAAHVPHHQELFVAAPVGDRVIEGYVDLLLETPDGLVIVDYKTDRARTDAEVDAAVARYELQGAAYAVALEHATGRTVADCRFVFCRPGGAVERSVTDLAAATAEVRRRVAVSQAGPAASEPATTREAASTNGTPAA